MGLNGWISLSERPPNTRDGEQILVWHVFQGTMIVRRVDCHRNHFYSHWQKIPADGWVSALFRKPQVTECDLWQCVLAYHDTDGFKVTGYHQFLWDKHLIFWRSAPEPPDNHVELQKRF